MLVQTPDNSIHEQGRFPGAGRLVLQPAGPRRLKDVHRVEACVQAAAVEAKQPDLMLAYRFHSFILELNAWP